MLKTANARNLATVERERERERERATLYIAWKKIKNVTNQFMGEITFLFNSLTQVTLKAK